MVIYEVNIKISPQIYEKYISWLDNHIATMMSQKGFIKFKKYETKNLLISEKEVCIHYFIENLDLYNEYIKNYSYKMRNDPLLIKYKNKFSISRRLLLEL